MFLIDDILLSPIKLLMFLGKGISEEADKVLFDEDGIKRELIELQLQFEMGKTSEAELKRQEKELLARLDAILKAKEGR